MDQNSNFFCAETQKKKTFLCRLRFFARTDQRRCWFFSFFKLKKKTNKQKQTNKQNKSRYRKVTELKRKQRQELDEWKQSKKQERDQLWRSWSHDAGDAADAGVHQWVANWKKQRNAVYQQLEQWKVRTIVFCFLFFLNYFWWEGWGDGGLF